MWRCAVADSATQREGRQGSKTSSGEEVHGDSEGEFESLNGFDFQGFKLQSKFEFKFISKS